jgi:hypothetical protein
VSLQVLPDAVLLVVRFLQAQTDVMALVGTRTYTKLPQSPTWPLVTVGRIGGIAHWPPWVDPARLLFKAWGDSSVNAESTTRTIAATVQAALQELPGVHDLGVVTGVVEDGGLQRLPDPTYTPAREVQLFSATVVLHPLP